MVKNRLWIVCFAAIIMTGCAGTLKTDLQGGVYPINYLMDSDECTQKSPVTIRLGKVSYCDAFTSFKEAMEVKRKFSYFIPLILVNFGGDFYNCELGRASIDRSVTDFVRSSYRKEAARSGCFQLVDSDIADYTLDISIVEHETKGPYNFYFYAFFAFYVYGYGYGQTAGPGRSDVKLEITLRDGKADVLKKQFESSVQTEALKNKNDVSELRQHYVISMVESLSMAFKDCIEKSIESINEKITGKPSHKKKKAPAAPTRQQEVKDEAYPF
jgi:hypothetical protein